jgi:small subunit ribosomal protein S16
MLKVRLQRIGKRGQAYFRVVVVEHTTRPKGKYLELLGSYDPHKNEINIKGERVKYWISKGAKMSPTVNNLLVGRKIIEGEKVQVWKAKRKPASAEAPAGKQEISEQAIVEPTPAQPV